MVGHFIGPDVTSNNSVVVASHRGTNVAYGTFTLNHTASGSTSIAMLRIPGGARVTNAIVAWNNDDLSTTAGAALTLQSWTSGTNNGNLINSANVGVAALPALYNPAYAMINYRHTASSQAVLVLGASFVGTGTATTIFKLQLEYTTDQDPDG